MEKIMTKKEALLKTIYNLENDVYEYNWNDCNTCNCGILARTILNGQTAEKAGLRDVVENGFGFSGMVRDTLNICSKINKPIPIVVKALKGCGFDGQDLVGLEHLSDEKIIIKTGKKWLMRSSKEHLIKYLKAWVSILDQE